MTYSYDGLGIKSGSEVRLVNPDTYEPIQDDIFNGRFQVVLRVSDSLVTTTRGLWNKDRLDNAWMHQQYKHTMWEIKTDKPYDLDQKLDEAEDLL